MKNELPELFSSLPESKEALEETYSFLKERGLKIVAYVSAQDLILAYDSEEQKKSGADPDLIICEDEEVLKAVGIVETGRIREAKEHRYLKEFLSCLSKEKREIFLLTKKEETLESFEEELKILAPGLKILGRGWTDAYPDNKEGLINKINMMAPEIIVSHLPYPEANRLIHSYGKYLNTSLWFTMSRMQKTSQDGNWLDKINKFIYKKLLNLIINHSKDTEKEEN